MNQFARAQGDVGIWLMALGTWTYQVAPRQPWDLKEVMRREFQEIGAETSFFAVRFGEDWWYYYDVIGNIGYGYFGAAAGFSEAELLGGAGLAQLIDDLPEWAVHLRAGAPIPRGFDQPQDQVAIQLGIRLWHEFGLLLTPEDLTVALALEPRLLAFENLTAMLDYYGEGEDG